jgi:hypothetical protein
MKAGGPEGQKPRDEDKDHEEQKDEVLKTRGQEHQRTGDKKNTGPEDKKTK